MIYDIKQYRNVPSNDRFVDKAEAEGYQVYDRNRRYTRLRKPANMDERGDGDDTSPADAQVNATEEQE